MNNRLCRLSSYVLLLCLCGCGTSHLSYIGRDNWALAMSKSALTTGDLSYKTCYFLVENNLLEKFNSDPESVIKFLAEDLESGKSSLLSIRGGSSETLSVLVDLCTWEARRVSREESIKYWMSACYYSYKYIFDKSVYIELNRNNPLDYAANVRYYNYSLSQIFSWCVENKVSLEDGHEFPLVIGRVKLLKAKSDLLWPVARFNEFVNGFDYLPKNFQSHSYVSGLGVPILGMQEYNPDNRMQNKELKELDLLSLVYPFTFLIEFKNFDIRRNVIEATPEFYDSFNNEFVEISGNSVPVSKDYTLALAKRVDSYNTKINGIEYLFNPESMGDLQGLYMLAPYNPDRIPVVLVHGLMSDPDTWLEMLNTLLNNRIIRENYQFWLYTYPTGQPVYYSEYQFRKALMDIRDKYNHDNMNPKFNEMVIIGHSMGGLLTRLSIQNSNGNELLDKILKTDINKLKLTDAQKKFMMDIAVFKALPFVRCVIFIATPHRGSEIATFTISRIGSSLITLPSTLTKNTSDIVKQIAITTGIRENDLQIPTGIDTLAPTSQFLQMSMTMPYAPGVQIHSIMGNESEAGKKDGSDGVVSYWSSHLDNAESELIVKSNHSVHQKPECIKEVFRILLEYLKNNDK